MLKKTFILVLTVAMLLSSVAMAEITNRDQQLLGGVAVSNANDTFFFAPMEEGATKHWGLYALSSCSTGTPIVEITNGFPARLVHADDTHVYFLGYTDENRTVHTLYSVEIATGANETLLTNIQSVFVNEDDSFLYVSSDDLYTLCSYDIAERKAEEIKDMSNSEKTIYDAAYHDGELYFITRTAQGTENGYQYQTKSGKATNLVDPKPALVNGLLYEGYRIYANDAAGTRIFAVPIGKENATQIGAQYATTLSSYRFGEAIFVYDATNHALVRCPLDGSATQSLPLDGDTLTRLIMGGYKDEILLYEDGGIYSVAGDLSSQTRLFDFSTFTAGQLWCNIALAHDGSVLMFGYGSDTYTFWNSMMPTGVYVYSRTGEQLFGYPVIEEGAEETADENANPLEGLGEVVNEPAEDDTFFSF